MVQLTNELIGRLVGRPFTPMLARPVGDGGWLGLVLGDLLLSTVGPLVFRKASGKPAGIVALVIAFATIAAVMVLPLAEWLQKTFPVMVVLGPLLVAQYGYWIRRQGAERSTEAYLAAEPGSALCVPVAQPALVSAAYPPGRDAGSASWAALPRALRARQRFS